jgi:hypothetical protein
MRHRRGATPRKKTTTSSTSDIILEPPNAPPDSFPVVEPGTSTEPALTDRASEDFATLTLAPTLTGQLGRIVSWFLVIYLWISTKADEMAIGIGRWIMGQQTVAAMPENIKLVDGHKKVKRRRRQAGTEGAVAGMSRLVIFETFKTLMTEDGYFPGMVNLSGVLCYMNSVLQVSGSGTARGTRD